jgi:UDPglucose 6-dehydrogenase
MRRNIAQEDDRMNTRISVVGLGKLGACMAATMASKGAHVMGVDVNSSTVEALNAGCAPVVEPHLQEMIAANRPRLRATTSFDEAVAASSMSFIVVPTPSDKGGGFSIRYAEQAARSIGRALRSKSDYHLVILTSTVLPGSTESRILPAIEEESGRKCGRDFGLCYNPEFIALGNVIHDLLNPDFILIGESDERTGAMLEQWYGTYCDNHPPVALMNFVNAELAKLSVNTFITMKITFANMLAAICEELPGADVDTVTAAIGRDLRIGRRYLTGGLGYGGPCFPRDNQALASMAQTIGAPSALAETTDAMNQKLLIRQVERVRSLLRPGMRLGILGLSYKPNTNVIEESQGLALAHAPSDNGNVVAVYDPLAMENARSVLKDKVQYMNSAPECIQNSDLVVIATPADEFRALEAADFPRRSEKIVVLDCWRILAEPLRNCPWVEYLALGVGHERSHTARALTQTAP